MFKWKSTERPSTPKLGSVALPEAFSPRRSTTPIKSSYLEKPAKASFFNRFRSDSPVYEKTHKISLSDGSRHRARAGSFAIDDDDDDEDEDEVIFKPQTISYRQSKASKQEEMERREKQEERELEEAKRLARKLTNVRITVGKSKAAKEEEMERWEEEEREREMDEMKKAAQKEYAATQAAPLKSCLKGSTPPQTGSATPSPQSQYEFPTSTYSRADLRRRDSSTSYYSDTEQHRPSYRSTRRSISHHAQNHHAGSYPPDPIHLQQGYPDHRTRNQSLTGSRHPGHTTPGHTPKYMKAYIKEVPLKDEAIALSWPLVDFETRRHARCPSLFFDVAFDPRLRGYEIQALRYGDSMRSLMTREEEKMPVSPHAFMAEMILVHEKLPQWPVIVHCPSGIRCIDVFRAIYDTYSIVLTKAELMHWGQEKIDRCQRAFEQRCHDGPQLPPVTKAKGLCRIDLLRGEKIFKGITPLTGPKYPPNCWQLHFESITRPRAS